MRWAGGDAAPRYEAQTTNHYWAVEYDSATGGAWVKLVEPEDTPAPRDYEYQQPTRSLYS